MKRNYSASILLSSKANLLSYGLFVCRRRKALMDMITGWTHGVSSVKQARVLLVGPVGAGKSSFFNSINSVFFKGYVSSQANTGSAGTSLTTQVADSYFALGPLAFCVVIFNYIYIYGIYKTVWPLSGCWLGLYRSGAQSSSL